MRIIKSIKGDLSIVKKYLKNTSNYRYPLIMITLLMMVLIFMEFKYPYFFLQDDNRDSYLPYFVHNYRSVLNGELALYNFHQFLGVPAFAIGQTGSLYPITYFSVFLSNLIFGHYFAAVDIQVIIHLVIGALGMYSFIKYLSKDQRASLFAGFTWSLSSFIIYASNSWIIVSAVAAYFPWMLLFSFKLYKTPTCKIIICAIASRVFLFYAGHIQYFIYSVIFEFITAILYVILEPSIVGRKSRTIKYLRKYFETYICVLVFSLPQLLPMWHLTTISSERSGKLPFEIFVSEYFPIDQLIKGLFYPFSQVNGNTYASFRNMLNLSHIGYITIILLIFGIVNRYFLGINKIKVNSVRLFVFVAPAILAFFWATNWIFNLFVYAIPVLNRFRWPFKVIIYFDFYSIVISALILSAIIARYSLKSMSKDILLCIIIIIQLSNYLVLYVGTPYKDFGEHHGDAIPLEEKLQDKLTGGRIISAGFDIWEDTPKNDHSYSTAPTLGFNYATLWGLDYFAGYDVMLSQAQVDASLGLNFTAILGSNNIIPIDFLRKAGVRWYIVPKSKVNEYATKLNGFGIVEKYEDENRVVFYDPEAYPMVFFSTGELISNEDYKVTTNNIELFIDIKQSGKIIFNYFYDPFFEGFIDGKKADLIPINNVNMSISVPEGKHHIVLKYRDPYLIVGTGCLVSFLLFVLSSCAIRTVIERRKLYTTIKISGEKRLK